MQILEGVPADCTGGLLERGSHTEHLFAMVALLLIARRICCDVMARYLRKFMKSGPSQLQFELIVIGRYDQCH